MTDIFALRGPGNVGKTDTLIRLFNALQAKYPRATVQVLHSGTRDIKVILHGIAGKIVGIESQGDQGGPNSRLEKSITDFVKGKCDTIFCACRTNGMTVASIKSFSPPHSVQFVPKTRTNVGHAAANSAMATLLMQKAGL